MAVRLIRFLCLCGIALIFGLAFAHTAELPGKLRLNSVTWLTVQHNLYVGFGVIASSVEPLTIFGTWVLVFLLRRDPARSPTLLAAILVTVGLVEWALVVAPMNVRLSAWTAENLPANWTLTRDRWELGHVGHAVLFGSAFGFLLASVLAETPARRNRVGGANERRLDSGHAMKELNSSVK